MKNFPHLVQLHRQLSAKGLVCVALNTETSEWTDRRKDVKKFLTEQDARFPNFILKDAAKTMDEWTDRHDANAKPIYLTWDRSGKRREAPFPPKPDTVDAFLQVLLDEK